MQRQRNVRALALVLSLALLVAACGSRSSSSGKSSSGGSGSSGGSASADGIDLSKCPSGTDGTGVSGDTITFGASYPQSGLYAPFASILKGAQAYFADINAKGGVTVAGKAYKIKIIGKDDAYDSAKTLSNTQSLVNDSKVFGMFSVVGTANNLAIRQTLNQSCVPDLFAASGSPAWGNTKYPWLIGSTLSPYSLEVKAFVDYLKANKPNAKVAILSATDDFGTAYEKTFKQLIKGTNITITQEQTYNPEDNKVDSQITSLAATKSDALLLGATLLACPAAMKAVHANNWNPLVYVSGTCAAKTLIGLAGKDADGILTTTNIKDPQNPNFASNADMMAYMASIKKFDPSLDAKDGIVAYGYTQAALLVETLKAAKSATRSAVMESALNLKDVKSIGLLLDGVALNSSPTDKFLGEQFQLEQYDAAKGYFNALGAVLNFDGQTVKYTPPEVING